MEKINNKDRLQIFKNNKIIANIYADDKNLFSFNTTPTNNINIINQISDIDTSLWHARLGHYNNKDIKNFVIDHAYNNNNKDCHQCKISKLKENLFIIPQTTQKNL